jgi:signal transduction histidine kinase
MNMMKRSGSPVPTRTCARRFSHAARAVSIHDAIAFGSVVAFALLCIVSARADTMPAAVRSTGWDVTNIARPLAALRISDAAVAWQCLAVSLSVLMILTTVALVGWCRTRVLLKRAVASARAVENEWQRRFAAVESREQASGVGVASQAFVAANLERERVYAAMRDFVGGPLSAMASLLDELNESSSQPPEKKLVGKIHVAVRAWARALEDMLASMPIQSRTVVFDETLTDVRELIDGVAALFSHTTAQKGVGLIITVDQSVDALVLADGTRLGQIIFHLLSRAVRITEHGQITVTARAETLNAGSQRIFVSVTAAGADTPASPTCSARMHIPTSFDVPAPAGELRDEEALSLELCQQLTQGMRGELKVSSDAARGTCSIFSAPFAIERPQAFNASHRVNLQKTTPQPIAAEPPADSPVPSTESFDRNYLDALSNEGVDLRAFIHGWRRSVHDDLQQIRGLRTRHDMDGMRSSLHRLSGAVGLVGAHSLMEALRHASATQRESAGHLLDELEKRIAALMMQLDQAVEPHRSNSQ